MLPNNLFEKQFLETPTDFGIVAYSLTLHLIFLLQRGRFSN